MKDEHDVLARIKAHDIAKDQDFMKGALIKAAHALHKIVSSDLANRHVEYNGCRAGTMEGASAFVSAQRGIEDALALIIKYQAGESKTDFVDMTPEQQAQHEKDRKGL